MKIRLILLALLSTLTAYGASQPMVGTNPVPTVVQLNATSNALTGASSLQSSNAVRLAASTGTTIVTSSPAPGVILYTITSTGGTGSGETNTVITLGSGEGVGLFNGKSGAVLNFLGLNAGQFGTNGTTASVKPFAPFTNSVLYNPSLPGFIVNRVQMIDGAGNETNHPTATSTDVDNIVGGSGPFQGQITSKTPQTIHDGSTNTIIGLIQGPWTEETDPATLDLSIKRHLVTLTTGFTGVLINTNNGAGADFIFIAATTQSFSIPGVIWPEGAPTNSFSGIYRFRLEAVGATRRIYGYYTSTNSSSSFATLADIVAATNSTFGAFSPPIASLSNYVNNISNNVVGVSNITIGVSNFVVGISNYAVGVSNFANTSSNSIYASLSNHLWFKTNMVYTTIGTNNGAFTNVFVNLAWPKQKYILTNNISVTNFIGMVVSNGFDLRIHLSPQLMDRTITYPVFMTPSLGYLWFTNASSPMYTTLTNGTRHILSISTDGTNGYMSLTEW